MRKKRNASGISVYLLEELGDARLRCHQLKRYLAEATSLIEKSDQRDHFFEVAGHLIQAIPDTLMRMQKSLNAAAMAVAKWDYEELSDEVRPEKVTELELALKDVRTRHVQRVPRRSVAGKKNIGVRGMVPMKVSETLRALRRVASDIERGSVNSAALARFIAYMEESPLRTASSRQDGAAQLRSVIAALQGGAESRPTPLQVANVLRRVLGETLDLRTARFEEGKPADPTQNMDEQDAEEWEEMNEEHKDNFKSAADDEEDEEASDKEAYDWKA